MSGLSLAVAPRSDPDEVPTLSPSAQSASAATDTMSKHGNPPPQQTVVGGVVGTGGVMGSLRVIELQLVAFIMVFSASGLVPVLDLAFPIFSTLYVIALSRLAFPSFASSAGGSREVFQGSGAFRAYVILGTTIGLFLPLAYVLGGFARGDDHAVRSATPHLFLLSCQILTENVISGLALFSPPVRAIVPLLYTVRRIFVVVDWMYDVWINKTLPANANIKDTAWMWFGRTLAIANLVYFSINLFGFLIPRFLPRAFEKYFSERGEVYSKTAEDKRAREKMEQQPRPAAAAPADHKATESKKVA